MVWRMHCTSAVCISQMLSSSSMASMASGLWMIVSFRPRNSVTTEITSQKSAKELDPLEDSNHSGTRRNSNNTGVEELTHDLFIRTENPPPQGSNLLSLALGQGIRCCALLTELLLQPSRLVQALL